MNINKRNCEVFSVMEGVYSRTWCIGKEGKCKRGSAQIWEKYEYRSIKIGKVRYGREKRF